MSYNTFAKFYDKLTENVEYKKELIIFLHFLKDMLKNVILFLIWLAEQAL